MNDSFTDKSVWNLCISKNLTHATLPSLTPIKQKGVNQTMKTKVCMEIVHSKTRAYSKTGRQKADIGRKLKKTKAYIGRIEAVPTKTRAYSEAGWQKV